MSGSEVKVRRGGKSPSVAGCARAKVVQDFGRGRKKIFSRARMYRIRDEGEKRFFAKERARLYRSEKRFFVGQTWPMTPQLSKNGFLRISRERDELSKSLMRERVGRVNVHHIL